MTDFARLTYKASLLLLPLTFGLLGLAPAGEPTDCRLRLLTAYHRLAGQATTNKAVYHLQFASTSLYQVPGQRSDRSTTVHGELYSQGSKYFFQTDDMSLWQDGRYVATVLHSQRTILLTRVVPGQKGMDPRRMLVRDSLIQLGQLQKCVSERLAQQVQQHIRLGYSGALAARLKVSSLDFWLTPQNILQQMSLHYQPGNALRQVTFRFPLQEWLATSEKLPTDARTQVIDGQGKILPAYQGYRLVNQITPSH